MLRAATEFISSLPPLLTFIVGVGLLLAGGRWLVEGAVQIALRLGVSTLLVGLTIVAFGTSSPELFFNVAAGLNDNADLSFGNVVGSNIANITLVLGAAAVVAPVVVHSRVIKMELPQLIAISAAMLILAWVPMTRSGTAFAFTRPDGAMLLIGFALFTWGWLRLGQRDRADPLTQEAEAEGNEEKKASRLSYGAAGLLFALGLALLIVGAALTEKGAVGVARALGMPNSVVGLTIVALATSLPEVVTSVVAASKGHGDLAVGNVIGSNLFNILLVLGATSVVVDVPVPAWGWWDLGIMLTLTLALLPIAATNNRRIVALEGTFLLLCYASYITFTIIR